MLFWTTSTELCRLSDRWNSEGMEQRQVVGDGAGWVGGNHHFKISYRKFSS